MHRRAILVTSVIAISIVVAACSQKIRPTAPGVRAGAGMAARTLGASVTPPAPGVVAGGFCTFSTGLIKNNVDVAHDLDRYFASGSVASEIFHVGDPSGFAYTWQKTGTSAAVGRGKGSVLVDGGVAALLQAIGTSGRPGALSQNATNPADMGTSGILGAQVLALKINQAFSEEFITPATGFSGLSLVDMSGVQLGGQALTPAQANALNGQATLQIREAADLALGKGTLPYGFTYSQLTDLIALLNGSFESCGPSSFAQAHLYQPFVTSNAFAGRRPSTVSDFAAKPTYETFAGQVVSVGSGCMSSDYQGFPVGAIALIERGGCVFYQKVSMAAAAGASAAIIFNSVASSGGCPGTPTPGDTHCEALVGMGAAAGSTPLPIPAAFVQRSTGLLLRDGAKPVTVFVQQ